MKATIDRARFATVKELFEFKEHGQALKPFPGYTDDQWGIKAHNRPWIERAGKFKPDERIVEVGGAYSLLPEYLSEKYGTESWIIDDFGGYSEETGLWQRWGNPDTWIADHPKVRYVKKPMGFFDKEVPNDHFDCVFSVSTLEHIPTAMWGDVFRDMLRITKPGGRQLHSIDIPYQPFKKALFWWLWGFIPFAASIKADPLSKWRKAIAAAGIDTGTEWPSRAYPFDRALLIESADVVFRFYPPESKVKAYPSGGYSLLVELQKHK